MRVPVCSAISDGTTACGLILCKRAPHAVPCVALFGAVLALMAVVPQKRYGMAAVLLPEIPRLILVFREVSLLHHLFDEFPHVLVFHLIPQTDVE